METEPLNHKALAMEAKEGQENGQTAYEEKTNDPAGLSLKDRVKQMVQDNGLILATLLAIVLGFCLGLGLRQAKPSADALLWLGMPGELFLRCLKSTIGPLVVSMVINSTSTLEPRKNGKIAIVALLGFFLTQLIAALIALVMFFAFQPDSGTTKTSEEKFGTDLKTQDVFADLLRNIVPDNVFGATISQTTTVYTKKEEERDISNGTRNYTELVITMERSTSSTGGINILGLITVCTAVGIAANKTLSMQSEFLRFFRQAQHVILLIIRWLFWTTPIGVASLIAQSVASVDDIGAVFYTLGLLVGAVVVGLLIYELLVIPAILFVFIRKNPYRILYKCTRPFFIAFAATATSVAMPEMLTSCDMIGIDKKVSSFVIPMSVTLHADGSALYIASAALFLARTSGVSLGVGNIFVIGTLTSVLSLAIPPVPSSSIVTLVIVLTSINVPLQDVALLFAVEWLLDRCRSGVNAIGHVIVAVVTERLCRRSLAEQPMDGLGTKTEISITSVDEEDGGISRTLGTEPSESVADGRSNVDRQTKL